MPQSKEIPYKQNKPKIKYICQKDTETSGKISQCQNIEPTEQQKKIELDYNLKYKINILVPRLN
jgi:hypothetical protein